MGIQQIRLSHSVTEYTCDVCDGEIESAVSGSFCSQACHYRHRGEKALNLLRHNHTICATCGRWLKTVEEPPKGWEERRRDLIQHCEQYGGEYHSVDGQLALDVTAVKQDYRTSAQQVVGFEYRTDNAEQVEKEQRSATVTPVIHMGVGCQCGQTNPTDVDGDLQRVELATTLSNYVLALWEFWEEGQLDRKLNKSAFFEAFKDSRDMKYALGVGLHE